MGVAERKWRPILSSELWLEVLEEDQRFWSQKFVDALQPAVDLQAWDADALRLASEMAKDQPDAERPADATREPAQRPLEGRRRWEEKCDDSRPDERQRWRVRPVRRVVPRVSRVVEEAEPLCELVEQLQEVELWPRRALSSRGPWQLLRLQARKAAPVAHLLAELRQLDEEQLQPLTQEVDGVRPVVGLLESVARVRCVDDVDSVLQQLRLERERPVVESPAEDPDEEQLAEKADELIALV